MVGRRGFLRAASLGLLAAGARPAFGQGAAPEKDKDRPAEPLPADEQLARVLATVPSKLKLPGMIGAIVEGDKLAAIGAIGLRKIGASEPMRVDDMVHLGSCTKALTATMIGTLVDEGKLTWRSTFRDVFPDQAERLHPEFRSVTLGHLLTHRAGLPHDGPWWDLGGGSTTDQRRQLLCRMLTSRPLSRPGTKYAYSNLGYALAGLMAEQVTGTPWEDLMRRRLFEPLGMATAGFGTPGTADRVDQPWGHRAKGNVIEPIRQDNAPSMGPAGTVHCSMADWAKFAALHLRGDRGQGRLLKPATFRTLHTPPPRMEYAGGWMALERSWAGGRALTHSGSNLSWYATIWLAPARDFATLVAINLGGDDASTACDKASEELIKYHFFSQQRRRR
jgi:CubicO group peptidase (beta-lactamase class C family)